MPPWSRSTPHPTPHPHPHQQMQMHIYQDAFANYADLDQQIMPQMPAGYANPLRQAYNMAGRRKSVTFQPPNLAPAAPSPRKVPAQYYSHPHQPATQYQLQPPMSATCSDHFDMVSLPQPPMMAFVTDSPPKRPVFSTFQTAPLQKPQKALFTTFASNDSVDKENMNPTSVYSDNFAEFPDASFPGPKVTTKRPSVSELAPIRAQPHKKSKSQDNTPVIVPGPEHMPPVEDDGLKPPYSYATLIGMSILRAPNRRLTLAQIYKWISDNFAYYRLAETGWQNSIRHNLSLNKAFVKQERPKDDPGKGNYWVIEPGMEGQFLKDKPLRRPAAHAHIAKPAPAVAAPAPKEAAKPAPILPVDHIDPTLRLFDASQAAAPATLPVAAKAAPSAPSKAVVTQSKGPSKAKASVPQQAIVPEQTRATEVFDDRSSDATVPASDAPGSGDDQPQDSKVLRRMADQASHILFKALTDPSVLHTHAVNYSSPPQMDSSPPLIPVPGGAEPTSPMAAMPLAPIQARSRKRTSDVLDDSGYFSTLTSSAKRPRTAAGLLPSDVDGEGPKAKPGRAEEAIARIRRSSNPSPTKPRLVGPPTSSPVRALDAALMLPPMTPATTFKVPGEQPLSASPNTNLRVHRDNMRRLVESPVRRHDLGPLLAPLPDASLATETSFFDDCFAMVDFDAYDWDQPL